MTSHTKISGHENAQSCRALGLRGQVIGLGLVLLAGAAIFDPFFHWLAPAGASAAAVAGLAPGLLRRRKPGPVDKGGRSDLPEGADPIFQVDRTGQVLHWNRAGRDLVGELEQGSSVHLAELRAEFSRLLKLMAEDGSRRAHAPVLLQEVSCVAFAEDDGGCIRVTLVRAPLPVHPLGGAVPALQADGAGRIRAMNAALKRLVGSEFSGLADLIGTAPLQSGQEVTLRAPNGPLRVRAFVEEKAQTERCVQFVPVDSRDGPGEWQLLDGLPVPILKIAPSGEIEFGNSLARSLLRIESGKSYRLSDLVTGLGRPVADWIADAIGGRTDLRPEIARCARGGVEQFLQIGMSRIDTGEERALIAVLNDATELKSLEAQFVQSQKMQAIGQLAGGVAHDFNNLLTAISGHCDLLLLRHGPGDPEFPDLEQISQNASRAASLVSQLLAFSRKQTMQPQHLDMCETLRDMTHLLNRLVGERITLELSHAPGLKRVRADKRQIEQVLMNLVVNARDAMPGGGTIEISTHLEVLETTLERDRAVVPAGEYVLTRVADAGVGIEAERLPKIFEPFYTTKRTGEGTGLGLSTAYGIIKQTGGYIFADSEPGQGTVFSIYLPAHDAPTVTQVPAAAPVGQPSQTTDGGVILLVEDEDPVRAFASRALRMRGYDVIEARNAEEALDQLRAPDLEVDVFVTDVIMPGLDGPSWVAEALKTRPGTRVVFVSGYAEENLSETQARVPNSVFLPKPFSLKDLTSTVHRQMAQTAGSKAR